MKDILWFCRDKLEAAFFELDDIVVALAPDAPQKMMDAWNALHDLMTPEFLAKRDKLRGFNESAAE